MPKYIIPLFQDIRLSRKAAGLSQKNLARKVGIPQSHLSKIENGNVNIKLASLIEILRALGLELMAIPREKIVTVRALLQSQAQGSGKDVISPAYSLDDELESEADHE